MTVRVRRADETAFGEAVAVFAESNFARRHGVWPHQSASIARLGAWLREPGSWLLVAEDSSAVVGIACAQPMRDDDGAGAVIPGCLFLGYLYVVPSRWEEGIGGQLLDGVLAEARRQTCWRVHLWTHEDNGRSHRLYRSRGFEPTGRVAGNEGEWMRDMPQAPPEE